MSKVGAEHNPVNSQKDGPLSADDLLNHVLHRLEKLNVIDYLTVSESELGWGFKGRNYLFQRTYAYDIPKFYYLLDQLTPEQYRKVITGKAVVALANLQKANPWRDFRLPEPNKQVPDEAKEALNKLKQLIENRDEGYMYIPEECRDKPFVVSDYYGIADTLYDQIVTGCNDYYSMMAEDWNSVRAAEYFRSICDEFIELQPYFIKQDEFDDVPQLLTRSLVNHFMEQVQHQRNSSGYVNTHLKVPANEILDASEKITDIPVKSYLAELKTLLTLLPGYKLLEKENPDDEGLLRLACYKYATREHLLNYITSGCKEFFNVKWFEWYSRDLLSNAEKQRTSHEIEVLNLQIDRVSQQRFERAAQTLKALDNLIKSLDQVQKTPSADLTPVLNLRLRFSAIVSMVRDNKVMNWGTSKTLCLTLPQVEDSLGLLQVKLNDDLPVEAKSILSKIAALYQEHDPDNERTLRLNLLLQSCQDYFLVSELDKENTDKSEKHHGEAIKIHAAGLNKYLNQEEQSLLKRLLIALFTLFTVPFYNKYSYGYFFPAADGKTSIIATREIEQLVEVKSSQFKADII